MDDHGGEPGLGIVEGSQIDLDGTVVQVRTPEERERRAIGRMADDGLLKLLGAVADAILGFLFLVVITRGLGPTGGGAFFEGGAIFFIVGTIVRLGADIGLVRMIPRYLALGRVRDVRRTILVSVVPVVVVGGACGALLFVFAPQLAGLVTHEHAELVTPYIRIFAPFMAVFGAYNVLLSGTRGFGTMLPMIVLDNVLKSAVRTIGTGIIILAGFGATAVAFGWMVPLVPLLLATVYWTIVLLRRAERRFPAAVQPPTPLPQLAAEFWGFASPRAFAAVFSTLLRYLDTLLVGGLKSTYAAGIYASAARYIAVGSVALNTMFIVVSPQLSYALAKKDTDRVDSLYRISTWWLMIPSWPLYLALAVFSPLLLKVFGQQFVAGQSALTILSLSMLVSMATGPVSAVLLMGGHSFWNMLNTLVSVALNVGLNVWLIPKYGFNGAAVAWAVSIVVNNVAAFVEVWLLIGVGPLGKGFKVVAGASLLLFGALGLVTRLVLGETVVSFGLYAVIATGLYLVVLARNRELLQLSILWETLAARIAGRGRRAGRGQPGR
jgi:O-antigen/teichoic acid export membrane protein